MSVSFVLSASEFEQGFSLDASRVVRVRSEKVSTKLVHCLQLTLTHPAHCLKCMASDAVDISTRHPRQADS